MTPRNKRVSFKEFEDHLSLIKYYHELNIQQEIQTALALNFAEMTPQEIYKTTEHLEKLLSHLENVIIGVAHFSVGKAKIKNPYPEKTLDLDYKKLSIELKNYFGTEESYKAFKNVRAQALIIKEKLVVTITTLENIINTKIADDSPATTPLNRSRSTNSTAPEHPTTLAPNPPAGKKKHKKHHHHKENLDELDNKNLTAKQRKEIAESKWHSYEISEDLLRFAATQLNAQYPILNGNGPQKRLATILLSSASTTGDEKKDKEAKATLLEYKVKEVAEFRRKYARYEPLMEKILLSLSVNFEMISNSPKLVSLLSNDTIKPTWFTEEDIRKVTATYTNRKQGFFSFFTRSNKQADSLIAFLNSKAELNDKRAAIEYYITSKEKFGFLASKDQLKNILAAMKKEKNDSVMKDDDTIRTRLQK